MTDIPIDPTADFGRLAASRALSDLSLLMDGGATLTQAVDWYALHLAGRSLTEWADTRAVDRNRITDNASRVDTLIADGRIDASSLPAE